MALLDLEARREGRPIGEPGAIAIPVNLTLPAGGPPRRSPRAPSEGAPRGLPVLQAEGGPARRRGAGRRRARGDRQLAGAAARRQRRVDGRRGDRAIGALEPNDLELVEQPCATLPELAEVRAAVSTPIAADESITGPDDVRAAAAARACDAVNVKLASCGGVERARAAIRTAGEAGIAAYLSSTFDGPWGISAALQLAAGETLPLACGLATLELFDSPLAHC